MEWSGIATVNPGHKLSFILIEVISLVECGVCLCVEVADVHSGHSGGNLQVSGDFDCITAGNQRKTSGSTHNRHVGMAGCRLFQRCVLV